MTNNTNKIVPHLWFDKEAIEAVNFYVSIFPGSEITGKTVISGTPGGDVDIVTFDLSGNSFMAINAGPMFKINPSISFYVYCGSELEVGRLYNELSNGGMVMMPLDKYPWSGKYAWVQDKYGLTWQLDIDDINSQQKILPSLLFANEKFDKVREAIGFYTSLFPCSKIIMEAPYDKSANLPEGTLLFAQYKLGGYLLNTMSSTLSHDFDFNEAVSLMVYCETQDEIDYYWSMLSDEGEEQQCGWVKDKFGVSWQVVPTEMDKMMLTADKVQLARVTEAMLKMIKLDISGLQKAYDND
jgi:predicted 3-demethylubiquinone-9 3-methyltransferase (glyoxalase superfamily)